ncbi:MAG: hypothetical protein QM500_15990 [Methylococcales bacterium]
MKHLIIIVFIVSVFSCVSVKKDVSLFDEYKLYVFSINENEAVFLKNMLSSEVRNKIKLTGEDAFPILSSFHGVLKEVTGQYQLINNNKGCLTVNGYDENKSPVSLYIEYINENSKWLLSYVEVFYLDSPKEFKNRGVCPARL